MEQQSLVEFHIYQYNQYIGYMARLLPSAAHCTPPGTPLSKAGSSDSLLHLDH